MNIKRFFGLLALLILIVAIPLAVFVSQRQQETRQRAAGEAVGVYFAAAIGTPVAITQITATGAEQSVRVFLNTNLTGAHLVNAFDITIEFPSSVEIRGIDDATNFASNFPLSLYGFNDTIFQNDKTILRYSRINNAPTTVSSVSSSNLHIATIRFVAPAGASASATITDAKITSPTDISGFLSVQKGQLQIVPLGTNTPTTTPVASPGASDLILSLSLTLPHALVATKTARVKIYDSSNHEFTGTGQLTKQSSGAYTGTVSMGTLQAGIYTIKIKVDKYLQKLVGKETNAIAQNIPAGSTYQVPATTLTIGDANNDNQITIEDYNWLLSCFPNRPASLCPGKDNVDFDESGDVGPIDLQIWQVASKTQTGD